MSQEAALDFHRVALTVRAIVLWNGIGAGALASLGPVPTRVTAVAPFAEVCPATVDCGIIREESEESERAKIVENSTEVYKPLHNKIYDIQAPERSHSLGQG